MIPFASTLAALALAAVLAVINARQRRTITALLDGLDHADVKYRIIRRLVDVYRDRYADEQARHQQTRRLYWDATDTATGLDRIPSPAPKETA